MTRNSHKHSGGNKTLIVLTLLALTVAGIALLNWHTIVGLVSRDLAQEEKKELREQITRLEKEIEELTEQQTGPTAPPPPPLSETKESAFPSIDFSKTTCLELSDRVTSYFLSLDRQEFMQPYHIGSSQEYFRKMVDNLMTNPPIVARETDSLFTILTNTAHFYRVLGKENIGLLKDVLLHEGDKLETDMALFYQWSVSADQCSSGNGTLSLPLKGAYEYAGFFLNTLGGQAYLFRRESRLRLLIKYYCILTLDRANAGILNRHGIDIVPHLESLTREMEFAETLIYREHYLRNLRNLQEKYQTYYQVAPLPPSGAE